MDAIADRLRAAREQARMSQADFGAIAGVKRNAQMNYENGTRTPDAAYLAALAKHGVDVGYVITGEVQSSHLSTDEALLLQAYRGLDQAGKTAALGAVVGIGQAAGGVTQVFHGAVEQAAGRDLVNHEKKR